MQAMKGGQVVRRGMGMGHPQSDADKATLQRNRLSGTCSYLIKYRPQEQQTHQWQDTASQPHPVVPWPEVVLRPLWQKQQQQNKVLKLWGSSAPVSRVTLPLEVGIKNRGRRSQLHRKVGGFLGRGFWTSFRGSMSPEITGKTRLCTRIRNLAGKGVNALHGTLRRICNDHPYSSTARRTCVLGRSSL